MEGYLELIIGPMFSGKTTRIVEIYNHYSFIQKMVMVINYAEDKRYHQTLLSTHDQKMIPCVLTENIADMWRDSSHANHEQIHQADVLLINEGQFFPGLKDCVLDMVEKEKKIVYICGLDGDFKRNLFGELLSLIPYCDNIVKLKSLCSICKNGKSALFSHRVSDETEQISIGADNYIPLCRECYISREPTVLSKM